MADARRRKGDFADEARQARAERAALATKLSQTWNRASFKPYSHADIAEKVTAHCVRVEI